MGKRTKVDLTTAHVGDLQRHKSSGVNVFSPDRSHDKKMMCEYVIYQCSNCSIMSRKSSGFTFHTPRPRTTQCVSGSRGLNPDGTGK